MKEKIIQYIQDELIEDEEELELTSDEDLLSSGLLDSLSVMRLITYVEKEFEVSVPPADMTIENFITVDALSEYIQSKK